MTRRNLAKKLIAAKNEAERKKLLKENKNLADEKLAFHLKEICLTAFTADPAKTQAVFKALKKLSEFNPNSEIKAYLFWVSGICKVTKGNLVSATKDLNKSAGIFEKIGQEHSSAKTRVAKLIPLALLGKYDEAIKTGKDALEIFEKYKDELAAGKIEKNMGNIVARRGREREAEEFYLSAMRRFEKLGDEKELTMSENSLANTYAELNNFRKAEKFYSQALERARKNEMRVTVAEIEASMGNLATFRGKFDDALRFLELSRQKYENLDMPHQNAVAELEIADIYLELNLTEEAFSIYRKVADQLSQLRMQSEEARARANYGKTATLLGEEKLAKKELEKSAKLYLAEKNDTGAATVKLSEAKLELDSENFRDALKLVREAEQLLKKTENARLKLNARWLTGETLRNLNEHKKAREILSQNYTEAIRQEQNNIAQSTQNSLGKLALQTGDKKSAKNHFRRALKLVENLREPLPAEEFRIAFLANKLAPFENLAKIYLEENKLKQAFFYIERSRSRSLVEVLETQNEKSDSKATDVTANLKRKLETLREELNWFYSRLNRAEMDETDALHKEIKAREKQISNTMRRIQSLTSSDAKSLNKISKMRGNSVAEQSAELVSSLQQLLGKQIALIEFVNFDDRISAFVITDRKIKFIANLASDSEIIEALEGLQFQFGTLRYGAKNLDKFMPTLKSRADIHLENLYEKLIAPLEAFLSKRDLVIVPVGALHYVPFNALKRDKKYLIEKRKVVLSPSAEVWRNLNKKASRKLKSALLIGFADEAIPLVDKEIKRLEKVFEKTKSLTGKKASYANYKREAEKFDVLHLACHGQFRPDNPMFSSLHLADGFITVRDICSQDLSAGLVTLSACETGLNKIYAGEEFVGLTRGFLSAGASSLVLSLWTVNDEATAVLMNDFYEHLQTGKTPSEALRKAQSNFIKRDIHPYFWSPFVIIGK